MLILRGKSIDKNCFLMLPTACKYKYTIEQKQANVDDRTG